MRSPTPSRHTPQFRRTPLLAIKLAQQAISLNSKNPRNPVQNRETLKHEQTWLWEACWQAHRFQTLWWGSSMQLAIPWEFMPYPHGQAMMLLLPHCYAFPNLGTDIIRGCMESCSALKPDRYCTSNQQQKKDALFETELFSLNDFFRREYGVPTKLSEMGISRKSLPLSQNKRAMTVLPYTISEEITEEVALTILEAA